LLGHAVLFAGGIVTNTNQSAEFMRTLNRNASTDLDAVYFNPAGTALFSPGLHLYLSNQSIAQTRTIKTNNPLYNSETFKGETSAPLFPNIYVAYNLGDLTFSGGFMPIGGGGSAEFKKGLPSFETPFASLSDNVPAAVLNSQLASYGYINGYSLEENFTGSSVYYGGQATAAYKISPMISAAVGLRMVYAKNTYQGYLRNIKLYTTKNPAGSPPGVLTSAMLGATFADKEVDAERTGSGISWLVSANFTPMKGLNLAVQYESITKLEMTNKTTKDDVGMFPDGEKINADIPAMIAAGARYQVMPGFATEVSYNYYFNTSVNWDGEENYVNNGWESGIAFEYQVAERVKTSVGFLRAVAGTTPQYQSDLSYSLNSNSIALGAVYSVSPAMDVSIGFSNTFYEEGVNKYDIPSQKQTYDKTAIVGAVGIAYSFK